ncbi:MAG TPA: glycosylase [Clostridiales bacterium]|nr:glycosylase [Clostridiales bacterium]
MLQFVRKTTATITPKEMENLYATLRTPNKHGAVMKWEQFYTDSPSVFRFGDAFYMYFIAISKDTGVSGYETHLARSADLLHWDYVGPIFRRDNANRWDSRQCAAYVAFPDIRWEGNAVPETVNGRYYVSYLGGNSDGYEPDPLSMGLASTADPTDPNGFCRLGAPILEPTDPDIRPYEDRTLFKSYLFRDPLGTTGHPYVNCYNARSSAYTERIYLAVSDDGLHWERYGDRAVIDLIDDGHPREMISGDPQILLIGDIYVMLFFRWQDGGRAFNTFAASRNLADWTVWEGKPLIESEYPWEDLHAHKTWFLRYGGRSYHFYCAVNSRNERFIALATD